MAALVFIGIDRGIIRHAQEVPGARNDGLPCRFLSRKGMTLVNKFLSLLSLASLSAVACDARAASVRTLVFLGDSLTEGYTLPRDEAFPARVEQHIRRAGLDWVVVNAGVNGDTSAGGLRRLPALLRLRPAVIFVCLGANDGLQGVPPHETERNLETIVQQSQAAGVRVVLAGMQAPVAFGEYGARFSAVFPRVAGKYDLEFMPFLLEGVALRSQYVLPDGVHPNAPATAIIARNVWQVLEPVLQGFGAP